MRDLLMRLAPIVAASRIGIAVASMSSGQSWQSIGGVLEMAELSAAIVVVALALLGRHQHLLLTTAIMFALSLPSALTMVPRLLGSPYQPRDHLTVVFVGLWASIGLAYFGAWVRFELMDKER